MAVDPTAAIDEVIAALHLAHDRLCRLLADTAHAVLRGGAAAATPQYNGFVDALRHHVTVEEELLLPLFDDIGAPSDPLRAQHRDLADVLARAHAHLEAGHTSAFCELAQELLYRLYAHCIRERRALVAHVEEILARVAPHRLAELERRLVGHDR